MLRLDRIIVNPARMNGQPCIRNLRLTVKRVVELVALYPDRNELFREFPELDEEDIRQALTYAAICFDQMEMETPIPHEPEHVNQIGEDVAVYDVTRLGNADSALQAAIGGLALQLAQLPAEDVFSAVQYVTRLQKRHLVAQKPLRPPDEIVAEARRQAELLHGVPRVEVARRFAVLAEEIRQQAVAQGTAFDGDWLGD